jgi:hypothetical protein
MKPNVRRALTALACLVAQGHTLANASQSTSMSAMAGVAFDGESVSIALLEARTEVTAYLSLAGAIGYLDGGDRYTEKQLRLMAISTWNVQRWIIDNRHLFSFSTESVERYRIRVRAARPGLFGVSSLSARAFDEAFFDLDQARFTRSNFAFGVGLQLNRALSAELYRVWEGNRDVPNDRYVLGLVTLRL